MKYVHLVLVSNTCVIVCVQDVSVLEKKLIEHEDAGRQPLLIVAYAGQLHCNVLLHWGNTIQTMNLLCNSACVETCSAWPPLFVYACTIYLTYSCVPQVLHWLVILRIC